MNDDGGDRVPGVTAVMGPEQSATGHHQGDRRRASSVAKERVIESPGPGDMQNDVDVC